jgi:lysine 6-dehydrogenase
MIKITVLGAGLVGKEIAADLSKNFQVLSVDSNFDALELLKKQHPIIDVRHANLFDENVLKEVVEGADLVVGCLPGHMGYRVNEILIQQGKNVVDISFFPEDVFGLDDIAKKHGVCCIVDCGVAPGMGNIILGYHQKRMKVQTYKCVVGGLPLTRDWPYEYKAVFSPIDVIEEYTRPARYVENGHLIIREALSDPEHIHFENVGTLEAWNSDGLRSLIKTMPDIPNMIEKTMRYPGTIEYLRVLRETGFFSYTPIDVNGTMIRPIDLTAKLLFPMWKLKPGEKDMTVMRINIAGEENGVMKEYEYSLYDEMQNNVISMARTTGYTCTAAVHLLANKMYSKPGVCPPEYLGEDETNFQFLLEYLKARNVIYRCTELSHTKLQKQNY